MSRYKDHRGPRRRGFDDDFAPPEREFGSRPSFSPPSRPAPSTGPVTDATVKWFNAEKGFGFVELEGGSEAFLHIRPLEAAGHSSVSEGARLKVRVGQGQKGAQVTEVVEVDTSTAAPAAPRRPARGPRFEQDGPTEQKQGVVKWYNPDKGFGFIALDTGGKDVFIHATTLERSGVTGLSEGQRVTIQVAQSQKGLEARSLQVD